jgi:excisionase family DNA binding protein
MNDQANAFQTGAGYAPTPYLTVLDVAKTLKITRATVYGWIFRRILPHVKVARFVRIKPQDFEEFLRLRHRGDFSTIPAGRTQTRPERW